MFQEFRKQILPKTFLADTRNTDDILTVYFGNCCKSDYENRYGPFRSDDEVLY